MRWLVLLALFGAGCSEGMPVYSLIEDLRVLAIRAEPPAVMLDAPTDVTLEALVVNPRGGSLAVDWSFCPVESSNACRDFEALVAEAAGSSGVTAQSLEAVSGATRLASVSFTVKGGLKQAVTIHLTKAGAARTDPRRSPWPSWPRSRPHWPGVPADRSGSGQERFTGRRVRNHRRPDRPVQRPGREERG